MLTLNDAYMEHIQQVLESTRALPIETRGVDNHKGLLSTVSVLPAGSHRGILYQCGLGVSDDNARVISIGLLLIIPTLAAMNEDNLSSCIYFIFYVCYVLFIKNTLIMDAGMSV